MKRWSQAVGLALGLCLLCPGVGTPQERTPGASDSDTLAPSSGQEANPDAAGPRRGNGAPTRPFPDERIKALRQQLDQSSDGEMRYQLYDELARGYYNSGRVAESLKVRAEIIEDSAISPGRRSLAASSLALSLALTKEYQRSQRTITRAKSLAADTKPAELELLSREPAYAFLSAEAEIARRFLNRHDTALLKYREASELAWANFNDPTLSEKRHRAAANEFLNRSTELARLMVQNNRRAEALSFVNSMDYYLDARPDLHATRFQRARVAHARAIALCSYDDYEGALQAINSSIAEYEREASPESGPPYADSLRLRLMIALAMGRIAEYSADADAVQRIRATDPIAAGEFPGEETDSLGLAAHGQWASAAALVGEAKERNFRHQGGESPFYKYEYAMQMLFRLDDPAGNVSLAEIERYVAPLASTEDNWADVSTRGSYDEDGALVTAMDRLMLPGAFPETAQAQALAFRIAELMRVNASQGALTDGAARLAASDPKLRSLIEAEQNLRFEQATNRNSFASAADRLDRLSKQTEADPIVAKRQAVDVAEKEKSLQDSNAKLTELRRQIATQFPIYRELVAPSIPSAAKVGSILHPDEVYVNLYAGGKASFAFVVLPGGELHAVRLEVTRAKAKEMTIALRKAFDAGIPPAKADDLAGFDLTAANGLYQSFIAPIKPWIQGKPTVYLSASGVLSSVPWDVLVTQPATTLANASWWIASATPVQMPSASALVLARSQAAQGARHAKNPFIAFADPSFDGTEHPAVETAAAGSVRERAIRTAGGRLSELDYHTVAPLPETFSEARAIASALNAPSESVIRGTEASRSRVMKEDLVDERVVTFATHGLLPGEVPGMLKAGLALAYEGRGLPDSVLTIDDIIGLRLNADWVVLSACNTGFASGNAGDTMSALSRGFFAAGARSLLATQWAVESESAKELTVGLFKGYAAEPTITKAAAMARVQRDMLAGQYGSLYRHPYFWGPYFVAGDAAR